jgi:hypothetical protein
MHILIKKMGDVNLQTNHKNCINCMAIKELLSKKSNKLVIHINICNALQFFIIYATPQIGLIFWHIGSTRKMAPILCHICPIPTVHM